jgi:hypothetical protein
MKVDKIHAQTKLKERAKQPIEQLSMFWTFGLINSERYIQSKP